MIVLRLASQFRQLQCAVIQRKRLAARRQVARRAERFNLPRSQLQRPIDIALLQRRQLEQAADGKDRIHQRMLLPKRRQMAAGGMATQMHRIGIVRRQAALNGIQRHTDLPAPAALTPLRGFQIKLLLIHFFRRVVLKDPLLPDALLPAQWEGQIARNLCINLYQQVDRAATEYVSALAETTIGALPAPAAGYYRRFGGLPRDPTY